LEKVIWEIFNNINDEYKKNLEKISNVELRKKIIAKSQEEPQAKKDRFFASLKKFLANQTELFVEADFNAYLVKEEMINPGESWEDLPLAKFDHFFKNYLEEERLTDFPPSPSKTEESSETKQEPKIIIKEVICNEIIRHKNANILTPIYFYREKEEYG